MKESHDRISREFLSNLVSFLNGGGEACLERGFALGREAIEGGFGVLKIAEAYITALSEILASSAPNAVGTIVASQELFSTILAPFEMTHRGYRDSIAKFQKLNSALEHQTLELASVNRELEAFASSVSHDLRAPVRAIGGFTQILLKDYSASLSKEVKELLSRIEKSTVLMGNLIEGLLLLSQYGHEALSLESVDLSKMAQQILTELKNTDPQRRVHIKVNENLFARGDHRLLKVVLSNLLNNAWKFTAKTVNTKIEFGWTSAQGGGAFFIKDNGIGFDMKYAEKLFRPFQRLHSKEEFAGTGVGLMTVQRIIHRHEGKIWAQAEINKGAQFYFTLGTAVKS